MSGTVYYAHTKGSKGERHLLLSHLRSTARMASEFAKSFSGDELAYFISLLHDLGKANPKFQDYLEAQDLRSICLRLAKGKEALSISSDITLLLGIQDGARA